MPSIPHCGEVVESTRSCLTGPTHNAFSHDTMGMKGYQGSRSPVPTGCRWLEMLGPGFTSDLK